VPYCTKCNRHGHPPKCCSGACANCNVGTSAAVEGEDDHSAEECPFAKCGNCGNVGHYTDECPHEARRARAAAARPVAGPRIAPAPTGGGPPAAGPAGAPQQQRRGLPPGMSSEQARETLVNRLADVFPQHVEKFIDPESHWSQSLVAAAGGAYADLLAALDQAKEGEFMSLVNRGAAAGGLPSAPAAAAPAAPPPVRAAAPVAASGGGAKAYVKGPDGKWHEPAAVNGPASAAGSAAAGAAAPSGGGGSGGAPSAPGAAAPTQPISYLSAVRSQLPGASSAAHHLPAAAPAPATPVAAPVPQAAAAAQKAAAAQQAQAAAAVAQQAAAAMAQQQAAAAAAAQHSALPKEPEGSNAPSSADAPAPPPQHIASLLSAAPGAGRLMHGGPGHAHGGPVGSGSMDSLGGSGPAVSPLSLAVGSPVASSVSQHLAAAGLMPPGAPPPPVVAPQPDAQLFSLVKRLQEQAAALSGEVGAAKDGAAAADAKAAGMGGRVAALEGRLADAEARAKSAEAKAAAAEAAALAARTEALAARQAQSVMQSTLLQAFRQMGVDTRLLEYYLSVQGLLGPTGPTAAAAAPGAAAPGAAASSLGAVGGGGTAAVGAPGGGAGAVGSAVGSGSGGPGAVGSGREVGGPVGSGVQGRGHDASGGAQGVAQAVERAGWGGGSGWGAWS
jgi:hypothetical protein